MFVFYMTSNEILANTFRGVFGCYWKIPNFYVFSGQLGNRNVFIVHFLSWQVLRFTNSAVCLLFYVSMVKWKNFCSLTFSHSLEDQIFSHMFLIVLWEINQFCNRLLKRVILISYRFPLRLRFSLPSMTHSKFERFWSPCITKPF
jgi:hypothetical protein